MYEFEPHQPINQLVDPHAFINGYITTASMGFVVDALSGTGVNEVFRNDTQAWRLPAAHGFPDPPLSLFCLEVEMLHGAYN